MPGGPEKITGADDPRHALQENGGLADFRYLDDGDIFRHPVPVLPYLQAFDPTDAKIGAERNRQKTQVNDYFSDLDISASDWTTSEVRTLATVDTSVYGNITFGIAVGPRRCIAYQLLAKVDVVRAFHERVQLCRGPQTEFALLRESPGVSRINNHIFRVHGHTILTEEVAAKTLDEVGQGSLKRLFPGFTEDSAQQAALSAGQSGLGSKHSWTLILGGQVIHQGCFLLQRLGIEVAIVTPSEWVEICRLRCA